LLAEDIDIKMNEIDLDAITYHQDKIKKAHIDFSKGFTKCPNCEFGYIGMIDDVECIGMCNKCGIEFKLFKE